MPDSRPELRADRSLQTQRLRGRVCALSLLLACCGCQQPGMRAVVPALPARHSVRSDQLLILSDFKLDDNHPLIHDLTRLREQIASSLELPSQEREVVVYLFSDEKQYRKFLNARYPSLPPRRAYFVGTSHELAVYTFWGDRVQEDLRHEFTHGLLHASLESVPLWLDEGLAEYFEVAGEHPGIINTEYAKNLSLAVRNGWEPNIERLEGLKFVQDMTRSDYQEAWAWVHFTLHDPRLKPVLIAYLSALREEPRPDPLSNRLRQTDANVETRFLSYAASLTPTHFASATGK